MTLSPIRDGAGRATGASLIARDVTEQKALAARLAEAERRERAGAAALLRAAVALNEAGTLDALMPAVAAAAAEAVGADRASVYAYDEARTGTIAAGHFAADDPNGVHAIPAGLSAIDHAPPHSILAEAEVIRTGRPLARDAHTPFPHPFPSADWRSDVVIPLLAAGAVQGVLYVRNVGRERVFTGEELALLQAIGNQAGLAVLRTRDAAAAARRADHLALLNQVGRAVSESLDIDELCAAIHAEIARVLTVDACYVALHEAGETQIWLPYLVDDGRRLPSNWLPLGDGPTSRVLRRRRPEVVSPDASPPGSRGYTYGAERRSAAALHVPMLHGDRLIGVLSVQRYDPVAYDDDDLRTLETIAQQAAAAFALARLHAETVAARDAATRHAADLEAVLTITRSIASATDLETVLDALADELVALVPHEVIALYRVTPDGASLRPVFCRERGADLDTAGWTFGAGSGLVGHAFTTGRAELINDAHFDPRFLFQSDEARERDEEHHLAVAPLAVAGQPVGVLCLSRVGDPAFGRDEFSLFRVLAEQVAAAIRNAELLARNRELYLGVVRALASAVDAKDPSTRGHSDRVGRLAGRVAAELGLDRAEAEVVELAGLLHDVGKIGVPDAILQKPGPLDDAERAIMVGHAALGAEILATAGDHALQPLVPLVRHHHERVDGGGYPSALRDDAIPLGAAIIAAADAFDTMVTDRPYRLARSPARALAELGRRTGSQFRPDIVAALGAVTTGAAGAAGADGVIDLPDPADGRRGAATGGEMGDTRALGLLVELAAVTRHIPDLHRFLAQVAGIVRHRLGYQDVMLLLVDRARHELLLAAHSGQHPHARTGNRQPLDVGVLGQVVATGRARNVADVTSEPDFYATWDDPTGSELAVPLVVDDRTIGVINVESDRTAAFTAADEAVLTVVAGQLAAAVHVAQLHDAAKRAAATDGLTGLANHRAFYDALGQATAAGRPLSVLLMDVEGLKRVNDSAGHLAGDALLRRVAGTIRAAVRPDDLVARYGGDEFAVILRGRDRDDASVVAARIRRDLQTTREEDAPATVRYGVAVLGEDGGDPIDLVAVADRRLYEMRGRR